MNQAERHRDAVDQLQFLGQLFSTETALFHQAAAAKCGLSITEMKTLSILLQDGAKTAGQIAQRLSLTTGAVTNVIDRLERHEMVSREKDPNDRRKVIVCVNPKSIEKTDKVYRSMGEAFGQLLEKYSVDELHFLVEHFRASVEITKQEIANLMRD